MNKARLMMSLGMLVFVGAVVVGGTGAFFSDTETSTGNVFTAGAIDLTVDSEAHYNGSMCQVDVNDYDGDQDDTEYLWLGVLNIQSDFHVQEPGKQPIWVQRLSSRTTMLSLVTKEKTPSHYTLTTTQPGPVWM